MVYSVHFLPLFPFLILLKLRQKKKIKNKKKKNRCCCLPGQLLTASVWRGLRCERESRPSGASSRQDACLPVSYHSGSTLQGFLLLFSWVEHWQSTSGPAAFRGTTCPREHWVLHTAHDGEAQAAPSLPLHPTIILQFPCLRLK